MGQFIKAIASFLGPIIASYSALTFGNWKLIFPVYALFSLLSLLWLYLTSIEEVNLNNASSFSSCLGLLKDKTILVLFLGIIFVVGLDVGLNTTIPRYIMEKCHIPLSQAGLGTSLYFVARTLGAFMGAILLVKISARLFFRISMITALLAIAVMIALNGLWGILIMIFILGFAISNVFSILYSEAVQKKPERTNEISGLMIMGITGGAVFPVLMGLASDATSSQAGGLLILSLAILFLLFIAFKKV